jgi:arsenate reductase-like glutaredoxin family protein
MDVQVFGLKNDADTRKALRFFKERRIKVHFVDFKVRGPSKGELRRFMQRFGADAVIDRSARRLKALGLHTAHYGADRWLEIATEEPLILRTLEIATEEPLILRTPLIRQQNRLTVGLAESTWKEWTAT